MDSSRARALISADVDAFEGGVMREMLSSMVDFDRLSSTFRFRTGSSRLDERALLDMQRLATYIEGLPEGSKVKFVGFTDSVGAFGSNRELSEKRAEKVMDELTGFAGSRLTNVEFSSAGFGEIAPSACNTAEKGRQINRRVEVWVNVPEGSNT